MGDVVFSMHVVCAQHRSVDVDTILVFTEISKSLSKTIMMIVKLIIVILHCMVMLIGANLCLHVIVLHVLIKKVSGQFIILSSHTEYLESFHIV